MEICFNVCVVVLYKKKFNNEYNMLWYIVSAHSGVFEIKNIMKIKDRPLL